MSRCCACGKINQRAIELFGKKRTISIICDCDRKKLADEKTREKQIATKRKIEKLQKMSLLGKRYQNVNFENTIIGQNQTFDEAFKKCKKYCDNQEENIEKGQGIIIYGWAWCSKWCKP